MRESPWGALPPCPPAGASPLHPTPFSLLRQRKGGNRAAGLLRSPQPAVGGLGFPALLDKGPTRRTRCARFAPSAQTGCASQKGCVPAARGPLVCAARRRRRRATANSQQPDLGSLTAGSELKSGCSVFGYSTPSAPPSSTEDRPACRRHATLLTRAACLSGGSRRRAQRVLAGAGLRAAQGTLLAIGQEGERSAGPPFFSPLFFGGAKKRGPGLSKERARPTAGLATPCEGLAACKRRDAGPEVLLRGLGAEAPKGSYA